ncbi:hypothetical protein GCM10009613_61290 [Pseudonocardia kongjuensis]|uniref:Phage tail protein n=1 Tax=Pseudonocardia kongjuensis TaxID=102227 RepID=A0ABP4J369_9PSEU
MSTRNPWSGEAWAGSPGVTGAGGAVINDPTRPDLVGWRWLARGGGLRPWAGSAWGGGGVIERPAQGGLLAIAEPDVASIRLEAWWSGAQFLRILRLAAGQAPAPVRDGYPLSVLSRTRRNRCADPSFERATTLWQAGTNTTVTGVDDTAAAAGTRVGRIRATAAGAVQAIVPAGISVTDQTQVSFALRLSAAPSGLAVRAEWLDETGAALGNSTPAIGSLASFVGAAGTPMRRIDVVTLVPPSGAGSANLYLQATGMAAGATIDVDAVLVEDAATAGEQAGEYFDGDVLTGAWDIAAHASVSTLPGTHRVMDREAPLDVPVRYVMTAPDAPGVQVLSEPIVLTSRRRVWLSHPAWDLPLQVTVTEEPTVTYPIQQEVLEVLGGTPVAVSGAKRSTARGTHKIATRNFDDRGLLQDMLDDGSPLLLRMPADHGHGPGEWIAIKDVTRGRTTHRASDGTYRFELPFTVVRAPALPAA